MGSDEYSPDPDIVIRNDRDYMPKFAGVATLPTPLRALQGLEEGSSLATPRPSEFTLLANRLRKIRLDVSPEDVAKSSSPSTPLQGKPVRLDFGDDAVTQNDDKENVGNGVPSATPSKPPLTPSKPLLTPRSSGGSLGPGIFQTSVPVENAHDSSPMQSMPQTHDPGTPETKLSMELVKEVPSSTPSLPPRSPEDMSSEVAATGDEVEVSAPDFHGDAEADNTCHSAEATDEGVVCSSTEPATDNISMQNDEADKTQPLVSGIGKSSSGNSIERSEEVELAIPTSPSQGEHPKGASSADADVNILRPLECGNAEPSQICTAEQEGGPGSVLPSLTEPLQKLLDGKEKWSWPKRCEAMALVNKVLTSTPSEETISTVRTVLPDLAITVNDNLDELRPSVITSALSLVNAVIPLKLGEVSEFAEEVFPSVLDLACGRSLTAQEAAKTLALVLSVYPDLSSILEDADNPDRLCELLELEAKSDTSESASRSHASEALKLVQGTVFKDASAEVQSAKPLSSPIPTQAEDVPDTAVVSPSKGSEDSSPDVPLVADAFNLESKPIVDTREKHSAPVVSVSNTSPSGGGIGRTPRQNRVSLRIERLPGSGLKSASRHSFRGRPESRFSTPVVRNMKLGDTVRKISPGSTRKRRMYTEEEMEEARRAAMRVVMEETSQAHAKEREQLQQEKAKSEEELRKEQSLVGELKSVLEEYELTMQKMVSQGNSQASAHSISLENETKKLKAELLEVTEAYETIKERYNGMKQTVTIYENKEARNIEQIKDLKRNMAELQKWSNDLKANSEKKLAKAFDSVTTYRASYMDREAHLSKAGLDLLRLRSELDKEVANHTETAANLSRIEAALHDEQDMRSSLEASLVSSKESVARVNSQKERLQKNLNSANAELKDVKLQLAKMTDADTRAAEAAKQLQTFSVESQSLKARAYDDMTRIRALQEELESKEKEYEEMSTICEEALSQLEKMKVAGK